MFQWVTSTLVNMLTTHHGGSITVVDRMTGFGWRDVETGFRDPDGLFWLASGNFDITGFPDLSISEAIELIKENANTCIPKRRTSTGSTTTRA